MGRKGHLVDGVRSDYFHQIVILLPEPVGPKPGCHCRYHRFRVEARLASALLRGRRVCELPLNSPQSLSTCLSNSESYEDYHYLSFLSIVPLLPLLLLLAS